MWDIDKAIKFLNAHAGLKSQGHGAEWTRRAIEAGGIALARKAYPKDYTSSLRNVGFVSLGALASGYQAGDVGIVEAIGGNFSGHMAMFNGTNWVSDFKQLKGLYPSPSYEKEEAGFAIHRYKAPAAG